MEQGLGLAADCWQPPSTRLPEPHGHFRLLGPVGKGGQGVVWQAESHQLPDPSLAVKFFLPQGGLAAALAIARREAERSVLVRHQYLARTHAFLDLRSHAAEGWPPAALVMTCYPGSLEDVLKAAAWQQVGVPRTAVIRCAGNLALVLDALHQHHGLVHRDLKPSNVLIDLPPGLHLTGMDSLSRAEAVLADLGVAGQVGEPGLGLLQDGWKAPELFADDGQPLLERPVDPAEDVYGFGRVLAALADAVDAAEELHVPLRAVARMCMVPEPKARPPSSELLGLLLPLTELPDLRRTLRIQELRTFPDRPRIDPERLDRALVAAYCKATQNEYHLALAVVQEANALRAGIDADAPLLEVSELPSRHAEAKVFWEQTFYTAFWLKGRMTAALLLAQDDARFDAPAREARTKLLDYLRSEDEHL
jgi:serine/threonine protein kinase